MPKRKHKKVSKKKFFRTVHLQAAVFLIVYTIVSKVIFIKSIISPSLAVNFFVPYFFGIFAGMILLYLFSHEDFFHFIKEIERQEEKKENRYLGKYMHYGRILATLIVATVGGPVFAALTIRLLLNKVWYKYLLLAFGNITSTLLAVSLARGLIFTGSWFM